VVVYNGGLGPHQELDGYENMLQFAEEFPRLGTASLVIDTEGVNLVL